MNFQNYIFTFKYYSPYAICLYGLTVTVTVSSWHLSLVNNCTLSQSHFIALLCLHGLAVNHFKITFLFEMTSFLLGWLNYTVLYCSDHGLWTPREEIAFTAQPKIHSHSQIFRYGGSIFCLPHWPNFSDIFDLCLHWVSVVRGSDETKDTKVT